MPDTPCVQFGETPQKTIRFWMMPMTHQAEHHAEDRAASPGQLDAADDRGGKHGQFVARSGGRTGGVQIGDRADAGQRGKQARQGEKKMRMRSTWKPTRRAASGLLPMANRRKPKAVLRSTISAASATTRNRM